MFHQVIFKSRRDHHHPVRMAVQKAGDLCQSPVQQRIAVAHADRGQRLRPKIAHLEHKGDALAAGQPPACDSDQQLRRRRNHNVRP